MSISVYVLQVRRVEALGPMLGELQWGRLRTQGWPSELQCTGHKFSILTTLRVETKRAHLVVRHVQLLLETRDAGVPNVRTILQ